MDLQEIIARNIRLAREEAGWGQARLARHLGLASHSGVSDMEAGRRRVSATELAKLGELFGRPLDWFLDRDACRQDFVALARALSRPESTKRALREAERLFENFLFLESVVKQKPRGNSDNGVRRHRQGGTSG